MNEIIDRCPVCDQEGNSLFLEVRDHFLSGECFKIVSCQGCGFKFVNPRPEKNEIGRYYQSENYISHEERAKSFFSRIYRIARFFSIRSKYKIVKKFVRPGKILDIGCGTGEFLAFCNSRGYDVTGVEPNEKAGLIARQVNQIHITEKLEDLPADSHLFDCITMWHVLEHVHDLNETLCMAKKKLAPDGIFIIAVPNCDSHDAKTYGKYWAAYDVPRHLYHFNEASLTKLVSNHGFEIRIVIPQRLDAYYVSMLSEKYRSGRNNYLRAFLNGARSNFMASKSGRGHSSRIFLLSLKIA